MKTDLKDAVQLLSENDNFLILIHKNPDGDTIGSGYALCRALQKAGKHARVECSDSIPERFQYISSSVETEDFTPGFVVAVDVADTKLLGDKFDETVQIDLCIDHHGSNTHYAKHNYVNSTSASNCENIYHVIRLMGIEQDAEMAKALYTGIATDTGCFKFSNTTAQTHIIAAELMEYDINIADINKVMFDTKTKSRVAVEKLALENMEFYFDDKLALITITKEMREISESDGDDLEGITSLPTQIEGILIGLTIRERSDGTYKVSVRTYDPINASNMCRTFGGGGHARAAGCEMEGDLQSVKDRLLTVSAQMLGVK
ncbi:MAG: hypothetical protein BGN88_04555 [Clostridiales bacterium 43-6]|nr:MAG: hypothetical protein BGN88_04555 [Clostridiales bacterium 43-6]